MESLQENLKYLVQHEPEKFLKLENFEKMAETTNIKDFISMLRYGCHIRDLETYNKMVNVLENRTGEPSPKWEYQSIKNKVSIDFNETAYTSYDFAYWMNMKYSDYGETTQDFSTYVKYTVADLEDDDYQGDASERAYIDGMEKLNYKKHKKY